jgi:hypothetical protein
MTKKTLAIAPIETDVVKLAGYKSQAIELAAFLRDKPADAPGAEAWFSSTLSSVRGLLKGLEDERTKATQPLLAAKRAIDALFAPATTPLKECETVIRGKLAEAATMRFAAESESRRLAETAAAEGRFADVLDTLAEAPEAEATVGSSARVTWVASVVDFSLLPDAYKVVNERALGAAVHPTEIPGVAWVQVVKVRAK